MKRKSLVQWINIHTFLNWMLLPLLCEKSILLVLMGLIAGKQLNKILEDLNVLKLSSDS